MSELLTDYIRFIEEEIDNTKTIDPDKKIKDQFDYDFDEMDFLLATIKFEMDSLLDIPRTPQNYELTLRELTAKISELPRIKQTSAASFLKKKRTEMSKIAQKMAADLNRIFG